MLMTLILAFICFAMFLVCHVALFHFFDFKRKFRAMFITALFFCFIFIFFFHSTLENLLELDITLLGIPLFEYAGYVYLYFFLWFFYFHSIIVVDRSISVRILVEVMSFTGGKCKLENIKKRYSLEEKFYDEIRDMLFLDRFIERAGEYSNTRKGKFQAMFFIFLRKFMNLTGQR